MSGRRARRAARARPRGGTGLEQRAVRSSVERVARMRESFERLRRAEALARAPAERALVRAHFANRCVSRGLSWDPLVAFREAQSLDPRWGALADHLAGRLHEATRPLAGPGDW